MNKLILYGSLILGLAFMDYFLFGEPHLSILLGGLIVLLVFLGAISKEPIDKGSQNENSDAIEVTGKIEEVHYFTPLHGVTFFSFEDSSGKTYQQSIRLGPRCLRYRKGQKITILFDEKNPKLSKIKI